MSPASQPHCCTADTGTSSSESICEAVARATPVMVKRIVSRRVNRAAGHESANR